jgi:8-oxo-dGTP pyrophosphatase MutT (NUDIX family)
MRRRGVILLNLKRKRVAMHHKRGSMVSVDAAGGVLYYKKGDALFVLLIYRNRVWDLPKGKLEQGEDIEECAAREVAEEVGLDEDPEIERFLCKTYHEYEQDGVNYSKNTYWYAMPAKQQIGLRPQQNEGITDLEWVTAEKALERVGFENLEKVLMVFMMSME